MSWSFISDLPAGVHLTPADLLWIGTMIVLAIIITLATNHGRGW